jgi:DNA-binding CsgD family transcriptional regulator
MNELRRDAGLEAAGRAFDLGELSPAERRVLALALEGQSVRDMTERLVLSEATVRSHLSRIYGKLGVRGRVELLARVAESGSGRPDPPGSGAARATAEASPESLAPIMIGVGAIVVASILLPFAALVTAPALFISGVVAFAGPAGSRRRRAAPWLLIAGAVTAAWLAVLVLGFVAVSSGPQSEFFPGPDFPGPS